MHVLQSLFYLTTAPHVLGDLSVLWVAYATHNTLKSVPFQLFHNSSRQQYGVTVTRCCSDSCFVLLKVGDGDAQNKWSSCQIK